MPGDGAPRSAAGFSRPRRRDSVPALKIQPVKTRSNRSAKQPSSDGGVQWFVGGRIALATPTVSIARDGRLRFNGGFLHAQKLRRFSHDTARTLGESHAGVG